MEIIILVVIVCSILFYWAQHYFPKSQHRQAQPAIPYAYKQRTFIMTKREHIFFERLLNLYGTNYYVFPQVHLSTILDHRIKGQDFRAALGVIQRKSVDYVICDKAYVRPIVAIELDDRTHDNARRIQRDQIVEEIFSKARMPLVRFRSADSLTNDSITASLKAHGLAITTQQKPDR